MGPSRGADSEYALRTALAILNYKCNQGSPPARGTLAPHAAVPDGCVVRRTPARSARGARRSRASQVASIGCPVRARGGAEAERRGRPCILKLVEVEFRSRRRRRDRDRGDRFPSCPHETLRRGRHRRRRGEAAARRRGALRAPEKRLGRLPIGQDQKFGLRCRPAASWGCPAVPDGPEGQARGLGARMML